MDPIAWRHVSDLFGKCLELPPEEREELLSKVEKTQPEILEEIRALLKTYEEDKEFLERPALADVAQVKTVRATAGVTAFDDEPAQRSSRENRDSPECDAAARLSGTERPASFWLLLTLDVVVLVALVLGALVTRQYGTLTTEWGWDAQETNANWYVTEVDPHGPAEKALKIGDEVVSINRERMARTLTLQPAVAAVCPTCLYNITVHRGGREHEFNIRKEIRQSSWSVIQICIFFAIAVTFYATAIFIGFHKPEQRLAQLACLSVLGEALIFIKLVIRPFEEFLQGSSHLLYGALDLVDGLNLAVAYHFYWSFFAGTAKGRLWSALRYFLYAWAVLVAAVRQVNGSRTAAHFWVAKSGYDVVYTSAPLFYLFASVAICSLIVISYRQIPQGAPRRRAKWIVLGGIVGIAPYLLSRLTLSVLDASGKGYLTQTETFLLTRRLAMIPTVFIPFTTAYAILQHRAFDIIFVVRRSLQYVLARNGLRLLLLLPIIGLCYTIKVNFQRTLADLILHDAAFIGSITLLLIVLRFRTQLGTWIDRRFFREQYKHETLLLGLSEHLDSFEVPSEMANYVGQQLAAVLHPRFVAILSRDLNARFSSSYSSDAKPITIPLYADSAILRVLETGDSARAVSTLKGFVPKTDWQLIAGTGAELVVSITAMSGELSGLLLLGAKQSEEPYSQYDRQLLSGIAKQIAIIYENDSLQKKLQEQRRTQQSMITRFETKHSSLCKECPRCGWCFDYLTAFCDRDKSELVLFSPIERIVGSKYRLDQRIARGGMATVYRGVDLRLNREVAIKVVVGNKWDDLTLRRFCREAKAVASLNHANIISTYDFGVTDSDCAYLVMELLKGPTLRDILQGAKPIPVPEIAEWISELLDGIEAAHDAKIIHRDLKPENLLISKQQYGHNVLKILDFGIAKRNLLGSGNKSSVLTQAGTFIGTVSYMSPEQLKLEDANEQSDLFSIAIILIELLTGRNPLAGASYAERLTWSAASNLCSFGESTEARFLRAIVQRCIADNSNDRPESACEMRKELIPAIVGFSDSLGENPR